MIYSDCDSQSSLEFENELAPLLNCLTPAFRECQQGAFCNVADEGGAKQSFLSSVSKQAERKTVRAIGRKLCLSNVEL